MTRWGIRARITLVAFVPMLALAALMTATHTGLRLSDLDEALRARAHAHVRQLALTSEYLLFAGDRARLQQLAEALLREDDVIAVTILDAEAHVLVRATRPGRNPSPLPTALPAQAALEEHRGWLRISEPVRASEVALDDAFATESSPTTDEAGSRRTLGMLAVDISLERLQQRRAELLRLAGAWMLMVAIGSLWLARRMSHGVSGPIRTVAEAVQRIGHGELHRRVTVASGGSLRALAEGVNEMAARLAESRALLNRRIDEATLELRARTEEAERANLAKSRFLAAASHDLRQPLHALGLFLSELSHQQLDARSRQITERLVASAEAMESLLDSLLDISRLDAGVLTPAAQDFDLQAKLEHVLARHAADASARGLALRLHCPPCWAHTDPHLFERIVDNLLGNAIRYTPGGGGVLLACRRRGEQWRVEVRDSGIGISADAQQVIFHEFVQLDNAERARDKGLGLGLAIVRRLVDLLGLGLSLRSAPERGSVFAVELPAAAAPAQADIDQEARALGNFEGLEVLVVDDDPLARDGMQRLLASWGCRVRAAEDAAQAMLRLRVPPQPDIVVTDLRLRGDTDGLALVERIRALPGLARVPAILVSGDTAPETLERIHASAAHVLHKPARPARLRALIHRLLGAQ